MMRLFKYTTLLVFFVWQLQGINANAQSEQELKQQVADLQKQLEQRDSIDSALPGNVKDLRKKVKDLTGQKKILEKKQKELQDDVDVEKAAAVKYKKRAEELKTKLEATEGSLQTEITEHTKAKTALEEAKKQSANFYDVKKQKDQTIDSLRTALNTASTQLNTAKTDLANANEAVKQKDERITKLRNENGTLTSDLRAVNAKLAPFEQRNEELARFLLSDIQNKSLEIVGGSNFSSDLPAARDLLKRISDLRAQNLLGSDAMGILGGLEKKLNNYNKLATAMQDGNKVLRSKYSRSDVTDAARKLTTIDKSLLTSDQSSQFNRLVSLLRGYCGKNSQARSVIEKANKFAITFQTPSEAKKEIGNALSSGNYSGYPYIKTQLESKRKNSNIGKDYNPFPAAGCQ